MFESRCSCSCSFDTNKGKILAFPFLLRPTNERSPPIRPPSMDGTPDGPCGLRRVRRLPAVDVHTARHGTFTTTVQGNEARTSDAQLTPRAHGMVPLVRIWWYCTSNAVHRSCAERTGSITICYSHRRRVAAPLWIMECQWVRRVVPDAGP